MAKRAVDRHRLDPGAPAEEGTRPTRLGKTLGMVVLAGLLGLTSWVVASVSTWLVPVYVTAMALIFVIPRADARRAQGPLATRVSPTSTRIREARPLAFPAPIRTRGMRLSRRPAVLPRLRLRRPMGLALAP